MFTADPNITDLKVKEKGIHKILFSMNIHQVATPELSAEDARSYVIFFREGSSLSAYIGIYFMRTDRRFYYSYTANPFPFEGLSDVEDEARGFVEDMGFVLDEINIGGMSLDEKNRWLDEQPMFSRTKLAEPQAAAPRPAQRPAASPGPPARPQPAPAPRQAVPAGAAGLPKQYSKQEARSSTGVVGRDKDALARLLASF
jgi:hypothetical protein